MIVPLFMFIHIVVCNVAVIVVAVVTLAAIVIGVVVAPCGRDWLCYCSYVCDWCCY